MGILDFGELKSGDILVLGAGATHSLVSDSPLLTNFLLSAKTQGAYDPDRRHTTLRDTVVHYFGDRDGVNANIEELATFLTSTSRDPFVPFDRDAAYRQLLEVVRQTLSSVWPKLTANGAHRHLVYLATRCAELQVPIVTFNYDLTLDNALYLTDAWSPIDGYGFRPSLMLGKYENLMTPQISKVSSKTLLLKLHGSLNWGIRRIPHTDGTRPVEISPSDYMRSLIPSGPGREQFVIGPIENNSLADGIPSSPNYYYDAVIVPPLLQKSIYYDNPAINQVWYVATQAIARASRIVVAGYSFPPSDFEARTLFREGLSSPFSQTKREIFVIDPCEAVVETLSSQLSSIGASCHVQHLGTDFAAWTRQLGEERAS